MSGRIELELRDVITTINHVHNDTVHGQTTLNEASHGISRGIHETREVQNEILTRLEQRLNLTSSHSVAYPAAMPCLETAEEAVQDCEGENRSASFIFRLHRRTLCPMPCICVCHKQRVFRSPNTLHHLLGSLFIGYNGSVRLFAGCDTEGCLTRYKKKWQLYYMFPRWMLDMTILFKIFLQGPEMLIRCLRVRDFDTTPVFQSLARGQLDQVRSLISGGQASVLDVAAQTGGSLLQVSRFCSFVQKALSDKREPDDRSHSFVSENS